jgi:L-ascorbate metabolism protein UlaG (beta-lactamase superfamily)
MIILACAVLVFGLVAWSGDHDGRKRDLPPSDHYNGKTFFNPNLSPDSFPKFRDAFKMMGDKRAKWPAWVENSATPSLSERLGPDEIALTFVNHGTFLIQVNGINILTDPVWSKRTSPVSWIGPKRVREPGDLILISHNHYDHLDLPTLKRLNKKFAPKVVIPIGDLALVRSAGCKDVVEMDWWESLEIKPGFRVSFTPSQHQANRGVFDRQHSLWGSYMVMAGERRIYFGGDSGYSPHFAETKKRLGAPDLALLGIGAYEPNWFMKVIHMNPAEAVVAHRDLESKHSVGMHFGTFQLSGEAIDQPPKDLKTALTAAGVPEQDFITMNEGETRIYGRK